MSVSYNPPIVTSGMVLCLDVGNTKSYPGSGATWTDLSPYGNNCTLVSSPTYDSANGGSLLYNGSTQYANFTASNLTTTATVEMWAKLGASYSGKMIMGWKDYDIWCNGGTIGYNTANGDVYGLPSATVTTLGCASNWKHYVFEFRSDVSYTNNKIYINGIMQSLSQQYGSETVANRSFNSGVGRVAYWTSSGGGAYLMPMNCSIFKVYNRSLTVAEIFRNFNASCGRYAIPSATTISPLTLSPAIWLDASDTSTLYQYNGGPLATPEGTVGYWLDKSGNNYHATQSTTTYRPILKSNAYNGQSYLLFDGVDDCIDSSGPNISQPFTFFVVGQSTDTGTSVRQFFDGITGARSFFGKTGADLMRYWSSTHIYSTETTGKLMHYYSGVVNGASTIIYKDALSYITGNPGANGLGGMRVGGQSSPTAEPWKGPICELLFFPGVMSDINRNNIQTYLAVKWGL